MDSTTSAIKRKSPETFGEASKRIRLAETTISGLKSLLLELRLWYFKMDTLEYLKHKLVWDDYFDDEQDRLSLLLLELRRKERETPQQQKPL